MNKKLLALAIGAAVVMPVAALADGPTLYGKINLSLETQTTNAGGATSQDNQNWVVANNASRIGLKGSLETSKQGLEGIYNAEFGLAADGDGGPLSSRDIYAGLKADWGTLVVGNVDTPLKSAQGTVDQFNDTTLDMDAYVLGETRANNAVAYISPKLADSVTVSLASWQGENLTQLATPGGGALTLPPATIPAGSVHYDGILESLSASVAYQNEGLYLALAMDKDVPTTSGFGAIGPAVGSAAIPVSSTRLVGTYTTESMTLGLLYQLSEESQINKALNAASANANPVAAENTSTIVSAAFKSGDMTYKLQYGMSESEMGNFNREGSLIALGADYAVGKATKLTAAVGKADGIWGGTGPLPVAPGGSGNTGNGLELTTSDDAEATVVSFGLEQKF